MHWGHSSSTLPHSPPINTFPLDWPLGKQYWHTSGTPWPSSSSQTPTGKVPLKQPMYPPSKHPHPFPKHWPCVPTVPPHALPDHPQVISCMYTVTVAGFIKQLQNTQPVNVVQFSLAAAMTSGCTVTRGSGIPMQLELPHLSKMWDIDTNVPETCQKGPQKNLRRKTFRKKKPTGKNG